MRSESLQQLLAKVRRCRLCEDLPLGPNPLVQASPVARILIAGQAPGRRAHASGVPFNDVSGDRLRAWLGIDHQTFYDATKVAILPMGFCYPGTAMGGDLPPRKECAVAWREPLLARLPGVKLTVLIGLHAQRWHLGEASAVTLTANVANWTAFWPDSIPLPHPSPRNARWLRNNPHVEATLLPALRKRVAELLA